MKKATAVIFCLFILLAVLNTWAFNTPSRSMPPYWSQFAIEHGWFDQVIEPYDCLRFEFDVTSGDLQNNSQCRLYYDVVGGRVEAYWLDPNEASDYEATPDNKKASYLDDLLAMNPDVVRNTSSQPITISFALTFAR
jgi:hypothetical protein